MKKYLISFFFIAILAEEYILHKKYEPIVNKKSQKKAGENNDNTPVVIKLEIKARGTRCLNETGNVVEFLYMTIRGNP